MTAIDELQALAGRLDDVLDDYEVGNREPQRAMEIISCLFNAVDRQSARLLPSGMQGMLLVVASWNRGDRADVDALATIAALARLARQRCEARCEQDRQAGGAQGARRLRVVRGGWGAEGA